MDYLAAIQYPLRRLLGLLGGVVDRSRLGSGRTPLHEAEADVSALLATTLDVHARRAFAKGLELIVEPLPQSRALVRTDTARLRQVLVYLVGHAVECTEQGCVAVVATATELDGARVAVCVGVVHGAARMPWEPRAQPSRIRAREGRVGDGRPRRPALTGSGVYIARRVAALMGGTVECHSEPGGGSALWLRTPMTRGPERATCGPPARRRHVLLVAAGPRAATAHAAVLDAAGVDVGVVARESLAWVDRTGYDAMLVHVPARALHDADVAPAPAVADRPVLAYAYTQGPGVHRQLLAAGYQRVVQKTSDPGTLRGALDHGLGPDRIGGIAAAPGPGPGGSRVRDRRPVLLVDDQRLDRKLVESYLADTPYEPVTVIDGDQALTAVRCRRFDAILIDVHRPGPDGLETTRRLRAADGSSRDIPVIAVTADRRIERSEWIRRAGVDDVLVKPLGRTDLLDTLDRWCRNAGATAAVDAPGRAHGAAGAGPEPPALIDEADGTRRAGGRADVARELLAMLARSLPESRDELERAHTAGDLQSLHAAAHRLKGAAAYCGVPRLRTEVSELAARAREGDAEGAAAAFERLRRTIEAVRGALGG